MHTDAERFAMKNEKKPTLAYSVAVGNTFVECWLFLPNSPQKPGMTIDVGNNIRRERKSFHDSKKDLADIRTQR